jgi:hypothetical protein
MKNPDSALRDLVAARDAEIQTRATTRLTAETETNRSAERKTERALAVLGDNADLVRRMNEEFARDAHETKRHIAEARASLLETPKTDAAVRVLDRPASVSAQGLVAVLSPYYVRLYNSDGTNYYSGYSPGNVDLWDDAEGSGSGLFGGEASSIDVLADWWFYFTPNANRWYNYTIVAPMHGFYICHADDGFWDSKEAHVRADLSAVGYQYNYKATSTVNLFDYDGQNINLSNRFDSNPVMYYSDLLGADNAYLRVTQSLYGYARGGGSNAELNFSDGAANYLAPPAVYVS